MNVRLKLTVGLMLLAAAGCGRHEAQFSYSDETQGLIDEARQAVEQAVLDQYGTPHHLVAWLDLPVDYGRIEGEVLASHPAQPDRVQVRLDASSDELDRLLREGADGTALLWQSGAFANIDFDFQTAGYTPSDEDAAEGELAIAAELDPPAEPGDRFVLVGSQMQQGRKLYMQHCMHCHGVSGDGDGPTAQYLNPRPRDYRMGVYKFTSTRSGVRASRDDLARIVRYGIPGTYMPSFLLLEEDDLQAIIEYIRWLTMRGETERSLIANLPDDYSEAEVARRLEGGEEMGAIVEELEQYLDEEFAESLQRVARDLNRNWTRPEDEPSVSLPLEFLERPGQGGELSARWSVKFGRWHVVRPGGPGQEDEDVNVTGLSRLGRLEGKQVLEQLGGEYSDERIVVAVEVPRPEADAASIARGRQLYLSGKTKCAECHGNTGRGDGPQTVAFNPRPGGGEWDEPGLFDDWGQKILPRDLTRGQYRGGRRPIDIFRRIDAGIKGTPMPAFGTALTPHQMWDIVNYVMNVPYHGPSGAPAESGSPAQVARRQAATDN